jgi:hypothetical protein
VACKESKGKKKSRDRNTVSRLQDTFRGYDACSGATVRGNSDYPDVTDLPKTALRRDADWSVAYRAQTHLFVVEFPLESRLVGDSVEDTAEERSVPDDLLGFAFTSNRNTMGMSKVLRMRSPDGQEMRRMVAKTWVSAPTFVSARDTSLFRRPWRRATLFGTFRSGPRCHPRLPQTHVLSCGGHLWGVRWTERKWIRNERTTGGRCWCDEMTMTRTRTMSTSKTEMGEAGRRGEGRQRTYQRAMSVPPWMARRHAIVSWCPRRLASPSACDHGRRHRWQKQSQSDPTLSLPALTSPPNGFPIFCQPRGS